MVKYNFTEQDKENIELNGSIETSGKISITELEQGTLNDSNDLFQTNSVEYCGWEQLTVWQDCSDDVHNQTNWIEWYKCVADAPPSVHTVMVYKCQTVGGGGSSSGSTSPSSGSTDPTSGNTGSGSGNMGSTGTSSNECTGTIIYTQPQDPTINIGVPCDNGVPTLPNLGSPNTDTPCEKIKSHFANEKFKTKYDTLTKVTPTYNVFALDHEKAAYLRYPTVGSNVAPSFVNIDMPACSTDGNLPSFTEGMCGLMHTHNNLDCNDNIPIKAPSPVDINTFLATLLPEASQYAGSYQNAFSLITTSGGNYMLMYSGTNYPGNFDFFQRKKLREEYSEVFQKLYETKDNVTQSDIEKIYAKFMLEKINKPGLETYRVTPTSAVKIEYDPVTKTIKETQCP